jgi:hypothetical protein
MFHDFKKGYTSPVVFAGGGIAARLCPTARVPEKINALKSKTVEHGTKTHFFLINQCLILFQYQNGLEQNTVQSGVTY